jgi:hypothetical protein
VLAWTFIRKPGAAGGDTCRDAGLDRRHHCAVDGTPLVARHDAGSTWLVAGSRAFQARCYEEELSVSAAPGSAEAASAPDAGEDESRRSNS